VKNEFVMFALGAFTLVVGSLYYEKHSSDKATNFMARSIQVTGIILLLAGAVAIFV